MTTNPLQCAILGSQKHWDSLIEKAIPGLPGSGIQSTKQAFDELRNSITGLPGHLSASDVSTFQHFVSEELECTANAFNAYVNAIGIVEMQNILDPKFLLRSSSPSSVTKPTPDFFAEFTTICDVTGGSDPETICNTSSSDWYDFERSELEHCPPANTNGSAQDDQAPSHVETVEPLGTGQRTCLYLPKEDLPLAIGVCPRDLQPCGHGIDLSHHFQQRTDPFDVDMMLNQDSDRSETTSVENADETLSMYSSNLRGAAAYSTPHTTMSPASLNEEFHRAPASSKNPESVQSDNISWDGDGDRNEDYDEELPTEPPSRQHQRDCIQNLQENGNSEQAVAYGQSVPLNSEAVGTPAEKSPHLEVEQQIIPENECLLTNDRIDETTRSNERRKMKPCLRLKRQNSRNTRGKNRPHAPKLSATQPPLNLSPGPVSMSQDQTQEIYRIFLTDIESHDHEQAGFLTRLYHAIASPDAFSQLRETIMLARTSIHPGATAEIPSVRATVRALDTLDSSSSLSHILRRYYLVHLVKFRKDRENSIRTTLKRGKPKKMLKYDLRRVDAIRQKHDSTCDNLQRNESDERISGRADSRAIRELLALVYPNQMDTEKVDPHEDFIYKKRLEKLKSRLSCGRTWFGFVEEFSIGILALIPCGGEYNISIDQVERLPTATLKTFLGHLQKRRGNFVSLVSQRLSSEIFNVLSLQASTTVEFRLEKVDQWTISQMSPDSHQLEMLCH